MNSASASDWMRSAMHHGLHVEFAIVLELDWIAASCQTARFQTLQIRYSIRDWQPSTVIDAPLTQLARGEARNATTAPTSSARPKRPNGSSRLMKSAMPCGIGLLALVPRAAGKQDRSGRDAVDADVQRRELLRERLGQADLGGLDGVVGHAAARLAAPDRRDHDDRAAAALLHVRHGQPRGANRRKQRLVERRLPLGVGRVEQVGARPRGRRC